MREELAETVTITEVEFFTMLMAYHLHKLNMFAWRTGANLCVHCMFSC